MYKLPVSQINEIKKKAKTLNKPVLVEKIKQIKDYCPQFIFDNSFLDKRNDEIISRLVESLLIVENTRLKENCIRLFLQDSENLQKKNEIEECFITEQFETK